MHVTFTFITSPSEVPFSKEGVLPKCRTPDIIDFRAKLEERPYINGRRSYEQRSSRPCDIVLVTDSVTYHIVFPKYSAFASMVAFEAMLGALTCGHIADFIGRKGVPVFIAEIAPEDLHGGLMTLNELMIIVGGSIAYLLGTVVTWRILALVGLTRSLILLLGMIIVPESPRWLVGVGLIVLKQLGGISAISSYASEILVLSGFSSGNMGTIIIACCQIPVSILGVILMDYSGRRSLVLVSATGTLGGNILMGFSFNLKDHDMLLKWVPNLVLTALPLVLLTGHVTNFMDHPDRGTFFLFLGIGMATVVFVAKLVPETKRKTLEEIQAAMNTFNAQQ
ncbi:hypothetical protein F0562_034766 [Nyssa sinensis]|uniref:Major facilitator superfamily (MFS) profile domain-containing protein n=1 Tax=Nyssa sinensis TaxID=561372 RepID=A0A5J5AB35_9ASTE|nr:hypothetical protein F0562_034766 [Nyssa sinensis]